MKTCLITGATSGIGRAAAIQLAAAGTELVLTGRNQHRGDRLLREIATKKPGVPAHFISADLSELPDVHRLANWVQDHSNHLDVLINNAGARFDTYQETSDGIERTFATNHLGHFLLTHLLMEQLVAAHAARIVVTGSSAHRAASSGGKWCLGGTEWDRKAAYAKSKLANVVCGYELAHRLRHTRVTVNVADPGTPATRFSRNNGRLRWLKHVGYHFWKGELSSAASAGALIVRLATSSELEGMSGGYFSNRGQMESSPASHDQDAAHALWTLSESLAGLRKGEGFEKRPFDPPLSPV